MKEMWGVMVMTVIGLSVWGQDPGYRLVGTFSLGVPVTAMKMTNLVFPVAVAEGVKVSKDILAQKVKGVENVVELKAVRRGFASTNLSVYGKDGRLYSFELRYVDDTTVLNYRVVPEAGVRPLDGPGDAGEWKAVRSNGEILLTRLPVDLVRLDADATLLSARRGFLHRRAVSDGLCLRLKGTYLRDSLLWLSLDLRERTAMGFVPAYLRVFVGDRKQVKRTASQEVAVSPVYTGGSGPVVGFGRRVLTVALRPMVSGKGRRLVVDLSDEAGNRQVRLTVKGKMLLRARKG